MGGGPLIEDQAKSIVNPNPDLILDGNKAKGLEDSEYNQPDPNAAPGSAGSAVHVEGAAGTAIFFHTGNLHAGTVRQTPRHRHSIHLYYVSCWQHYCVPMPAALIFWDL